MFRQTLTAGSIHASLLVTPSSGILFERRLSTSGSTAVTATKGVAPKWLRLTRNGTTILSSISADGVNWTNVGIASVPFNGTIYVGMAVTSHRRSKLAAGVFDSVKVTVDQQGFLSLPKGQQYFTTVVAEGPSGGSRSSPSPIFTIN